MKTFESGTTVDGGYYWHLGNWEIASVQGETGTLQGKKGEKFVRLPLPLLFVAAPVMGGLFVMFLPFIGFALTAGAATKAGARAVRDVGADLAALVSPGWRAGEAHMQGKRSDANAPAGEAKPDDGLEKLAQEIDEKRKDAR